MPDTPVQNYPEIYTREGLLEVINGLPMAIVVVDQACKVMLANKAACLFVNKDENQLIGHIGGEAFGCINQDDAGQGCGFGQECVKCKLRGAVLTAIEKKEAQYMVETTMVFKSPGERHLRISTQPMVLSGREMVLLAIEDITESKKYEKIAMEKEKLSAAIQIAGSVCHEMNQPLMAILGFSELLAMETDDAETRRANIAEIRTQAERLSTLSKKMMAITRYKTKDYLRSKIMDIDASSDKE